MFVELNQGVNIAEESPFVSGDLEYYLVDEVDLKDNTSKCVFKNNGLGDIDDFLCV